MVGFCSILTNNNGWHLQNAITHMNCALHIVNDVNYMTFLGTTWMSTSQQEWISHVIRHNITVTTCWLDLMADDDDEFRCMLCMFPLITLQYLVKKNHPNYSVFFDIRTLIIAVNFDIFQNIPILIMWAVGFCFFGSFVFIFSKPVQNNYINFNLF